MNVQQMISTHPDVRGSVSARLVRCIEECFDCAQTCITCADACVAEESVQQLRQCIRLNLDCADVCGAAGALASRRTGSNEIVLRAALELCSLTCRRCAEECERHASRHEHCRVCGQACRDCERACAEAMSELGPGSQAH
jgi:uncharacterized protein DUF326